LEEQGIQGFPPHREIIAKLTWLLRGVHDRQVCSFAVVVAVQQWWSVQSQDALEEPEAREHRQQPGAAKKVGGER
jgi:hypothetical protein